MENFGAEKHDPADKLNQAVFRDDPETARNLLKAAGNSCAAIDLVKSAINKNGDRSGGIQFSLDELDGNSKLDRLSLSRKDYASGSPDSTLPVVSIIINRCER